MQLVDLLEEVYPYDKEVPLELLRKYDFETILNKAIQKILTAQGNPQLASIILISYAPSVFLSVNNRLKGIIDQVHKGLLEMLIADVLSHLIEDSLKISNRPATDLRSLKVSLENASDLEGYDFPAVLQLLKYEKLETTYTKDKPLAVDTFWYNWRAKPHELDSIAKKLIRQGSIKSVRDFRELFDDHKNPNLRVMFANDVVHFLVVLFDDFHPLRVYGIDFNGNFLITTEPKLIKAALKKDVEKLEILQNKANDWLTGIVPRITSKLPLANERRIKQSKI